MDGGWGIERYRDGDSGIKGLRDMGYRDRGIKR